MPRTAALLLALALLAPPASAIEVDTAIVAYDTGKYDIALAEFHKLAELGVVLGYTSLGYMYAHGEGTAPDMREAARWLRKAAERGDAASQLALGALHFHGDGVERSLPAAFAWFNLAAVNGRDDAIGFMQAVVERLPESQVEEARALAESLFGRFSDRNLQGLWKKQSMSDG